MERPQKLFPVFRVMAANNVYIKKPPLLREAILLQKVTTPESSSF